jgi:inosine/xanthosine triphosphatase
MNVAVGSLNPTKIEGTRQAFSQYFDLVNVRGVNVKSGVENQPFDDNTIEGAINRAIKSYNKDYDFSVGVEAGLFKFKGTITGYIDFQIAAIFNGEKTTIGFGPGFEYPPSVVDKVLEGTEVGDVMEELTGIQGLGESFGAIHYLTGGIISRTELSRIAVTMALVPWINLKHYEP